MSAAVPLLEKGSEVVGGWSAVYEGQMDSHLMVAITPASDCIVAAWKVDIDTKQTAGGSLSYTHPQPIYILFNPWSLNDSVYMPGNKSINNSLFNEYYLCRALSKNLQNRKGFMTSVYSL